MNRENLNVEVETKVMYSRMIIPILVLLGLLATVFLVKNFPSVNPKAKLLDPTPTPIAASAPSPLSITPPYIRLYTAKNKYPYQANVPVEVYLQTAEIATNEVHLSLSYNPEDLTINLDGIEPQAVFPSFGIESFAEGKLEMTLFVPVGQDYTPVTAKEETKIAVLNFKTGRQDSEASQINLLYNKSSIDGTSLIEAGKEREEKPGNALKAVSGITLAISP